ncbi:MAG TPA: VWA domain-containing protein [Bryobacteraceae bacterium]|jgi:VWFA-related protein
MKVVSSLLIATLALPLQAQNPTPATGDNVFRTAGQEVLLDVVVRDKKGHLIKDLKKEDFQVSDDGASQKILTFRLRQGGEMSTTETAATAAPKTESKFDPSKQVRLVTLAFDRLGSEGRKLSRQAALDVLKGAPEPNLYWAVFMMDQRLSILQQYTSEKDKIEAGVDKATAASFSLYTEESDRIAKELEITSTGATASAAAPSTGGPPAGEAQKAMADMTLHMLQFADAGDRNQQGQAQLFGLAAMIREQKRLPGRKTLIYFTGGLNIPPDREDFFKAMIADANRANVTVYCIDANGLGTWNQNSSGNGMLAQAAQAARNSQTAGVNARPVSADDAQSFDRARDATMANPQVALEELSKSTGGIFIANSNDLRGPLRKVTEEINTYYEITYTPTIDKYDGHFRKIAVTLSQPDLKVQTRSGYYALPSFQGQDLMPYEMPMLSALSAKPIPRDIGFRTAVKSFVSKSGTAKQVVIFDIPTENVTLTKDEAAKNFRLHMSLLGLIKDSTGAIVQKISRDVNTTGQLENYDATRAGHFIYTQYMTLAPGRYTLESAVLDREAMKVGAKKQAVIVVPPSKELAISSLTLVRKLAPPSDGTDPEDPFVFKGGKVTPELNESVKGGKGAAVGLYFVVYAPPAEAATPKLDIEFVQDGKLIAKSEMPLPKPDQFGRINYAEQLPIEGLKAGQYEVYAKVFENGKGVQERMMLNIEE